MLKNYTKGSLLQQDDDADDASWQAHPVQSAKLEQKEPDQLCP